MIENRIPNRFKNLILENVPKKLINRTQQFIRKRSWKGDKERIFCLSMQRSGTTSVGDFFSTFGFPSAGHSHSRKNNWSKSWYNGDYDTIFNSREFLSYQVFQDDPWWAPDFYKVLYHKFPNAKFILLTRDSKSWFNSMLNHSGGKTLGNTQRHCKIYRREFEYYQVFGSEINVNNSENDIDNLLSLDGMEDHYRKIYELRNMEIINFFKEAKNESFIVCDLMDQSKWKKIGNFMKLNVPSDFNIHSNKSKIENR